MASYISHDYEAPLPPPLVPQSSSAGRRVVSGAPVAPGPPQPRPLVEGAEVRGVVDDVRDVVLVGRRLHGDGRGPADTRRDGQTV